ncbi:hypothetical protein IAI10_20695 [Clostridium sp. 19966]|uniref:hypothetical protein n=1 Tax=Clostridium sp. 19966 TaxID=2768166 RepID=UPI0028DF15D6|nr:hypothetical protein [Clostridium sp. 19966]MDT8719072.1 hypothetical protein [Clostridium sp. 19966]
MNVISVLMLFLGVAYGLITALAAFAQISKGTLNHVSIFMMLLGAISILISVVERAVLKNNLIYLLILGLLLIHIAAVNNGIKLYGKIHFKHHAARAMLSLLIIIMYAI